MVTVRQDVFLIREILEISDTVKTGHEWRWKNSVPTGSCEVIHGTVTMTSHNQLQKELYMQGKGKGCVTHSMKAYMESESITPFILNLETRWASLLYIWPSDYDGVPFLEELSQERV